MKSDDIQHDIERTRGEMASTLEAIERKLSPRQLMDQAVDTMRDLAIDTTRIGQAVRENPVPLALIGLGLGWLAISGMRGRSLEDVLDRAAEAGESALSATSAWSSATAEKLGEGIGGEGRTQRLRAKASEIAGQARDILNENTEVARRKVSEWSHTARTQANTAAEATVDTYRDHPLAMGAAAALLGVAIGAMLPRTRQEREIMGEAAGTVVRGANEMIDKAGRVANRVVRTARKEGAEAIRSIQEQATSEGTPASSLTH
jgi:ElaB/YqjD/DUF883 family membrane-anchored ribosome-binding protein